MVIDASVLTKLFCVEDLSANARQSVAQAAEIRAPAHVLAELGEVLSRKAVLGQITWEQCELAVGAASKLLQVASLGALLVPAFGITREIGCAVYDLLYLALASERQDILVSWDKRLLARVKGTRYASFVRSLDSIS